MKQNELEIGRLPTEENKSQRDNSKIRTQTRDVKYNYKERHWINTYSSCAYFRLELSLK